MSEGNQGRPRALITGASGGIGLELARVFAAEGYDLALVARSGDKLAALAAELERAHRISVKSVVKDLAREPSSQELFDELQREGLAIDVLVNNAGFGSYGHFAELGLASQLEMIRLNMLSLTALTHLFLGPMLARGRGKIMNVASTAAFQPGPLMAVYYASKAYVLSFSEALANELSGTGVTVSALCPGPTRSDFQGRAGIAGSRLVRSMMDSRTVAEQGYRGLLSGEAVVITGVMNKLMALLTRFLPRKALTQIVRKMQESRKE
jgi:uncharacterized protein